MSLFKKLFGAGNDSSDENKEKDASPFNPESKIPVDEMFTFNFKKNGGKFLYCENLEEVNEQFLNILEENDWFECEAICYEPKLYHFLDDNRLTYKNTTSPKFLLASCENLIADEGSVLLTSNQIKQNKPHELPANIVVFATTSQILESKSDGLREIKKRYDKDYPTNITTIKYFEKAKEEDFLHYGSAAKNLYLLLLEDL
ncbi:MAG TPA: LUD domain-containing protein [Flavobacterium sp.]|uniref:LUD domain-containing protein n=1 Tax=unclassified Flavobacterium TaxID=196869 RepID=UPI0025BE152C|nr:MULTISPECIES: LUD domain-containing protein [unclassified Flavobacterium]HRE76648.1 LUD domain-containing protein [Flavobacterium sp.]